MRRWASHCRKHNVVAICAALVRDRGVQTRAEEVRDRRPFTQAIEGSGNSIGTVIADDDEALTRRRYEAIERREAQHRVAETDRAGNIELIVIDDRITRRRAADFNREGRAATKAHVPRVENAGARAGGPTTPPLTVRRVRAVDCARAAERSAAVHSRVAINRTVDIQSPGIDRRRAGVSVGARKDERAGSQLR